MDDIAGRFLLKVSETDQEVALSARIFNHVCLGVLAFIAATLAGSVLFFTGDAGAYLLTLALAVLLFVAVFVARKRGVRAGSALLTVGLWVVVAVNLAFSGGVNSLFAPTFIAIIAVGGVLLGPRFSTMVALLTGAFIVGLSCLESLGYNAPDYYITPPHSAWALTLLPILLILAATNGAMTAFSAALKKARQEAEIRKKTEESLRESEELYRSAMENATVGVCLIGLDGGVMSVNRKLCDMLGYSAAELMCMELEGLTYPEDSDVGANFVNAALAGGPDSGIYEKRYICKSNEIITVKVSSRLHRSADGNPLYFITHIHDITDRKKAEESLRFRIELDRAVTDISTHFIAFNGEQLDNSINIALEKLRRITGADRSYVFRFSQDGRIMDNTHVAAADNVECRIDSLRHVKIDKELPWFAEKVRSGEVFCMESASDLPPEAELEEKHFGFHGVQSLIAIPMIYRDKLLGFLGFDSVRKEMVWKDPVISSLTVLGNILSNTLERKRAEDSLRANEEKLSRVIENIHDVVYQVDMEGRIIFGTRSGEDLFGCSVEEIIGKQLKEFYAFPEERDRFLKTLMANGSVRDFEAEMVNKDGSHFWVSTNAILIKDEKGNPVGIEGVTRDITATRTVREALIASEEKYRTVVEESFDGIFVQKGETITFANSRLHELLGYDPGELVGLNCWSIYSQDYRDAIRSWDRTERQGQPVPHRYEVDLLRKDGTTFPVEAHAKAITFDNEQGIQVWVRDLIEQKALQKRLMEAQKTEALGTLTGGIAHDFNNLLTIINGYTELMIEGKPEDDPDTVDLRKILETGLKGADLVKKLLAFSKEYATNPQPLGLNQVVENTVELTKRAFPKIISIETILEKDLSLINADPSQLQQALMNLCINAREAMPDGGRLTIETRNTVIEECQCEASYCARPGRYVSLEISDTGAGMSEETVDRIFDPFFTTKGWDFRKGTGLGLSVTKGIVEQHSGWISCESRPCKGTTFKMYFPAIEAPPKPEQTALETDHERTGGKIMIVDDEELVAALARRILEQAGYQAITASNGKEAVAIYKEQESDIDLVILDLVMPEMDGERCLEELLKIDPYARVILSTGYSISQEGSDHLRAHAKGVVNKPYQVDVLVQSVRRALEDE